MDLDDLQKHKDLREDAASKWAWDQVKNDCGLQDNLPVGEEMNHYAFFLHGWNYRKQLATQERGQLEGEIQEFIKELSKIMGFLPYSILEIFGEYRIMRDNKCLLDKIREMKKAADHG